MPVAIGSEEPDLLKRQAAGVEARLVVLQADMDNHTARPSDKRDMPVKAEKILLPWHHATLAFIPRPMP